MSSDNTPLPDHASTSSSQPSGKPALTPAPKPIRWFRTVLAAAVLLLMGSILLNFWYWSQATKYAKQYKLLLADQTALETKSRGLELGLKLMREPGTMQVLLKAAPGNENLQASVFYNAVTHDVFLLALNLPAPEKGQQHQLWAEVEGGWVKAGLLTSGEKIVPVKMNSIEHATGFVLTIEPEGGSQQPTLTKIVAQGKP